jgi:hypothetical protein
MPVVHARAVIGDGEMHALAVAAQGDGHVCVGAGVFGGVLHGLRGAEVDRCLDGREQRPTPFSTILIGIGAVIAKARSASTRPNSRSAGG